MKLRRILHRVNWDGLLDALTFASIIPIGGALIVFFGWIESLL